MALVGPLAAGGGILRPTARSALASFAGVGFAGNLPSCFSYELKVRSYELG